MNQVFAQFAPSLYISASHLVSIPKIEGINSIITFPAFEAITNYKVWVVAFTVAIIASLETLLNLEAVDNIDPHKRQSPPNRELLAQSICHPPRRIPAGECVAAESADESDSAGFSGRHLVGDRL